MKSLMGCVLNVAPPHPIAIPAESYTEIDFAERESLLNLGRRTVNLRRSERTSNEGSTGPKRLVDHSVDYAAFGLP